MYFITIQIHVSFQRVTRIHTTYRPTDSVSLRGDAALQFLSFVSVFKALLSHSEELGKACTYKYSEPWLGSSLLLVEGKCMNTEQTSVSDRLSL